MDLKSYTSGKVTNFATKFMHKKKFMKVKLSNFDIVFARGSSKKLKGQSEIKVVIREPINVYIVEGNSLHFVVSQDSIKSGAHISPQNTSTI